MQRGCKLRNHKIRKLENRSRGYVLISLMLFLSLLAIAALAALPKLAFQVQRDREEEMIHRGLAYSRGIRCFYRKFGRYPMRIEDLENTNNLRFIRKRYTDPMNVVNGKEQAFKILRFSDVNLPMFGQPGGAVPGQIGAPGVTIPQGAQGQQSQPSTTTSTDTTNTSATAVGAAVPSNSPNPSGPSDSSSSSSESGSSSSGFNGPVFGGGPILGVASASKKQTVREFCNKNHYKDWFFIYDPTTDRGGALNAPWCPIPVPVNQGLSPNPNQPGAGPTQPNAAPQTATPPAQSNPSSQTTPQQ